MPLKTKIFVAKLPPSVEDFRLRKLFERFGEVTEVANMGNYAFVHMATEDQASDAIENLNNYEIDGVSINVVPSTGEKRGGGGGGGGGGGRGGGRGGFRGGRGGPPMGRGGPMGRPGPYDRPPMDRFGPPMGRDRYDPPMDRYGPPMGDRYGPPMKRGFDDYDRMDRRGPPMERRPLPMDDRRPLPMDDRRPMPAIDDRRPLPMARDPYDRYDAYDRMGRRSPPPMSMSMARRSPPPMERRAPMGYDRREDLYGRRPERDPYGAPGGGMDRFAAARERSPPRGFGAPMARDPIPPRRF
ncbi:unnamed protein product [Meganyctiphanes norvegica]|uniref:RRM domain-containing protein n=1 Tax=Meganyctiphanes norvegica TaxID=48144 RepID=A0AAV2QHZ5_MEGNR